MRKAGLILLILLIFIPVLLTAQDNDPSIETDWDDYTFDLFGPGDQTFIISLGVVFPTIFINNGNIIEHKLDPPVGGTGSLNYNYYLSSRFFIGGEVGGMFVPTIAGDTLFIIPLGVKFGTQFIAGRFEFPISASIGMVWHTFLDYGYYGLYMKAGGSAYFRATNNWAFGISTNWFWFPEWTGKKENNVDGNFLDLTLSARYHF